MQRKAVQAPVSPTARGVCGVANVYVYRFDYAPPTAKQMGMGAFHPSEMAFVFGNISGNPMYGSAEEEVQGQRGSAWRLGTLYSERQRHLAQVYR